MKYCGNCGYQMDDSDVYCGNCGSKSEIDYGSSENTIENYDSRNHNQGIGTDEPKKDISGGKLLLKIMAWIFLFPFMLIYTFFKSKKINKWVKIGVIMFFIGSNLLRALNLSSDSPIPTILLLAIIIGSVYGNKRDKKARNIELEEERLKQHEKYLRMQAEEEKKEDIIKRTIQIVFSNKGFMSRVDSFILQHTKRYDFGEITSGAYSKSLNLFKEYVNKNFDFKAAIPEGEENNELIEYWETKPSMEVTASNLENYINDRKVQIYTDEMRERLKGTTGLPMEEVASKYLDIYGEKGLKVLNLMVFSRVLEEDVSDITQIVKNEYDKKVEEYERKRIESQLFSATNSIKDIEYVDKLNGFEFEDFLKDLFISFGYRSEELPYSNDYGADLIINKGFNKVVIQAKNYAGSVGNKAVQEAVAAKSHYKCDTAMVISNAHFTQNAIKTAETSDVILVDRDKLIKILEEGEMYFNSLVS